MYNSILIAANKNHLEGIVIYQKKLATSKGKKVDDPDESEAKSILKCVCHPKSMWSWLWRGTCAVAVSVTSRLLLLQAPGGKALSLTLVLEIMEGKQRRYDCQSPPYGHHMSVSKGNDPAHSATRTVLLDEAVQGRMDPVRASPFRLPCRCW